MKRLSILLISSTFLFAQDLYNMRLLEGINQVQRSIELAKKGEADKQDPYHFEKARASRDVANLLASDMDEVGSRLFMVKSFNALSKTASEKVALDNIEFITQAETKKVKKVEYGEYGEPFYYDEEEGSKVRVEYEKALGIDINSLNSALRYARENKALSCAPVELARGRFITMPWLMSFQNPNPASQEP